MSIVEKLIAGAFGTGSQMGVFDAEAHETWPWLWELLTLTELKDGKVRIPSSLKIQLGRAEWMASINDEDTRQTLLVACPCLAGLFKRVEEQLHSADAVWRQWPPKPGAKKKS